MPMGMRPMPPPPPPMPMTGGGGGGFGGGRRQLQAARDFGAYWYFFSCTTFERQTRPDRVSYYSRFVRAGVCLDV